MVEPVNFAPTIMLVFLYTIMEHELLGVIIMIIVTTQWIIDAYNALTPS
jgi:hypothetical protein